MFRSVYSKFTSIYEFSVALRLIPTPLPNNSIRQAHPIRRVSNNGCHEDFIQLTHQFGIIVHFVLILIIDDHKYY